MLGCCFHWVRGWIGIGGKDAAALQHASILGRGRVRSNSLSGRLAIIRRSRVAPLLVENGFEAAEDFSGPISGDSDDDRLESSRRGCEGDHGTGGEGNVGPAI